MDIKKLVKSQRVRHKILRLGRFLPDSVMIPIQYRLLLKRWPDLENPKRFTEWIQYCKKNYHNPLMLDCVDKFEVREFVGKIIGNEYLTELYASCDRGEDINFARLPKKFVIKSTSGGNGDNVLVIHDKSELNVEKTIKTVNSWLNKDYSNTSREWAYKKAAMNPKIIVEEFIEHNPKEGLDDYKFFCFMGKCQYYKVDFNRYTDHKANYFRRDGSPMKEVRELPFENDFGHKIVNQEEINELIALAEKLAVEFPFVRVDFYKSNHKIFFGELTFYPASGYSKFSPDSVDEEFGKYFPDKDNEVWTKYMRVGK